MAERSLRVRLLTWGPLVGLLALFAILWFWVPGVQTELTKLWELAKASDSEGLSNWFKQFGFWGPVVIVLFMVLQMFLLIFPSWLPMLVCVEAYGPWFGSLISLAGVVLASFVGYWIGRSIGSKALESWLGEEKFSKISDLVDEYGAGGVALFRLSPFLSTDAISIVAGLLGMPFRTYLIATVLGTIPLLAIIAWFGRDISSLKTGMWWLGGFGVLSYLAFIVWTQIRKRKHPNKTKTASQGSA